MRKFFCAFFILFCFSLFAQEGDSADSALNPGLTEGYDNYGNFEESLPENQQKEEKDVSQDYLAKSSTAVNAVAWTRDGKYFATSWNNSIILWSAASNTIEAIYSNSVSGNSESHKDASGKNLVSIADASSIEFTSDGRYMLSVRDDNTALIHAVGSASDATLISGTGSSIPAAVYASDYKIIIALDGQNLYESYRMGNQHIIEEKLDLADGVWALSSNPTGKRILVTSESGAIRLIDTTSWSVVSEFECYTLTRIKPRLAKDGVHFVSAKDQNTLTVTSVSDESDFYMLEDPAGFSNVAEFSVDGSKIVVGINTGLVKIFDINSGFEENSFQLMYGDSAKSLAFSPDGEYVIDHIEGIIEHQKVFMKVVSEIRSKTMMTFPVLTFSLLYQDGKFVDMEFARWCNKHNMQWFDSNFYVGSDVTSLSNCCRLISNTSKLNAFINSIGGTSLSIGSIKVNTINLRRIALESKGDMSKYFEILKERVDICVKVLDVVRDVITENIKNGLLPNYTYKLIELEKQYNTIGITAMYEAVNEFGLIDTDEFGNKSYSDRKSVV